jgi:predicted house-cleaning noncanonical NTP pyrophosphatase (MazG superfamily)
VDTEATPGSLSRVLADVATEREAQDRQWGVQEFPDGTGPEYTPQADEAKLDVAAAAARGELTWRHILAEEFFEALAESDPIRLRTELVQTAAVAAKWIQSLDRRHGTIVHRTHEDAGPGEKLVRDKIPDLIRKDGRTPDTRLAEASEYPALLRAKLYEEAGEYITSGDPAELADLLEVVHALAALHGMTPEDLERQRAAKATERGGFTERQVLRLPRRPA